MISVTFGDMLYYPQSGCLEKFPSPESLKHRIIISTKAPKEDVESNSVKGKESSSQKEGDEDEDEEESPREEVCDLLAELEDEETVRAKKRSLLECAVSTCNPLTTLRPLTIMDRAQSRYFLNDLV